MDTMTLCELLFAATMLHLTGGAPAQARDEFPDVPRTHWAYEAVTDLKAKGILVGYPAEPVRSAQGGVKKKNGSSVTPPKKTLPSHRKKPAGS
jgi:hypothetical protein